MKSDFLIPMVLDIPEGWEVSLIDNKILQLTQVASDQRDKEITRLQILSAERLTAYAALAASNRNYECINRNLEERIERIEKERDSLSKDIQQQNHTIEQLTNQHKHHVFELKTANDCNMRQRGTIRSLNAEASRLRDELNRRWQSSVDATPRPNHYLPPIDRRIPNYLNRLETALSYAEEARCQEHNADDKVHSSWLIPLADRIKDLLIEINNKALCIEQLNGSLMLVDRERAGLQTEVSELIERCTQRNDTITRLERELKTLKASSMLSPEERDAVWEALSYLNTSSHPLLTHYTSTRAYLASLYDRSHPRV